MRDSRLEGIKVVAVDDDADSRDLLKAILQHSAADTTVVSSGQEALEAIAGSTVRIPNEASAMANALASNKAPCLPLITRGILAITSER